jgi:hypothetical protein
MTEILHFHSNFLTTNFSFSLFLRITMKRFIVYFEILQLAAVIAAGGTVYLTDLPYFTQLAPCAASAASYVVQGLTDSKYPQAVTALQSCACSKDLKTLAEVCLSNGIEPPKHHMFLEI